MDRKFTRQAEAALKLAKTTAKSCEHSYIGTEHLLTGLLKEPEGTAGKILAEFGVDQEKLMELIGQLVAPPQGETALKEPKDPKDPQYSPRSRKILEQALEDAESMEGTAWNRTYSAGIIKRDRLCGNQTSFYNGSQYTEAFRCCSDCNGI